MGEESSLKKVVVRTRDGEVISGFAKRELFKDRLKTITRHGEEQTFSIDKLKAVFFVRDFRGNPQYEDVRFLSKQPVSSMIWVRAEFFDGEVLEGKVSNDMDLLNSPGFYLWPSDQDTNNKCVYVIKSSLTKFTILCPV